MTGLGLYFLDGVVVVLGQDESINPLSKRRVYI